MVYLDELGELEDKTNNELALLFQVSETQIRQDKSRMLQTIGEELTADNAMALVSKHTSDIRALIRLARRGLKNCEAGGLAYRNYLETLMKLEEQHFSVLQEIGIVRKELGHMQVTHEEWEAKISSDAIASVGPAAPSSIDGE